MIFSLYLSLINWEDHTYALKVKIFNTIGFLSEKFGLSYHTVTFSLKTFTNCLDFVYNYAIIMFSSKFLARICPIIFISYINYYELSGFGRFAINYFLTKEASRPLFVRVRRYASVNGCSQPC